MRRAAHALQVLQVVRVQTAGGVFDDHLAEAVDRAQRGAQVVGGGVHERLEFLVGRLEP
jgi:hypothetical protein